MAKESELKRRLSSCGLIIAVIAPLLLSACATTIKVPERPLPEVVVDPLRLSAGLYYDDALLDVEYVEKGLGVALKIRPGRALVSAFDAVFDASFEDTQHLGHLPFDDTNPGELDVVVILAIKDFRSSLMKVEGGPGELSLFVEVTFRTVKGDHIDNITVGGQPYKISTIAFSDIFGSTAYYSAPVHQAIRSAAAEFATNFRESPDLASWLNELNTVRPALEMAPITSSVDTLALAASIGQQAKTPGTIAIISDTDEHAECLEQSVLEADKSLRIIANEEFTNAFFPWFEDVNRSMFVKRFRNMGRYSRIQERAGELGLTHAIIIDGSTTEGDLMGLHDKSWGGCVGAMPAGVVCMGMQYADKTSRLRAEVLDLTQSGSLQAQAFDHTVTDEIVWPNILIPFIPIVPDTDEEACQILGREIASHLLGKSLESGE
jgi:hypothetical protein